MNVEIGVSKLNKPAACRAIRSSDTHNSESIIDRNFLQRSRAHAMHSLLLRLNVKGAAGQCDSCRPTPYWSITEVKLVLHPKGRRDQHPKCSLALLAWKHNSTPRRQVNVRHQILLSVTKTSLQCSIQNDHTGTVYVESQHCHVFFATVPTSMSIATLIHISVSIRN
jgi:hypothetical protein